MNNEHISKPYEELEYLKHSLDFLETRLASYPTGGRPSYVSADIASDKMVVDAIQRRLAEIEQEAAA